MMRPFGWGGVVVSLTMACGLRSDPQAPDDVEGTVDRLEEGDPLTCTAPVELSAESDSELEGRVPVLGAYTGWCGGDLGGEHVYAFESPVATDVTLRFDPDESDPISLRVVSSEENCLSGDEAAAVLCDSEVVSDVGETTVRHFFAAASRRYWIIFDSPDDRTARYRVSVELEPPSIEQCRPHPERIVQQSGTTFSWENTFTPGHGVVDGGCGGPGKENMFELQGSYEGEVSISVVGIDGFDPVISLRSGCGGTTELLCRSAVAEGTPGFASLQTRIASRTYWLAVDNASLAGGTYSLDVTFE